MDADLLAVWMRLDLQFDTRVARGRCRRQLKRKIQCIHMAVTDRASTTNEVPPGRVRTIWLRCKLIVACIDSAPSAVFVECILKARILCGQQWAWYVTWHVQMLSTSCYACAVSDGSRLGFLIKFKSVSQALGMCYGLHLFCSSPLSHALHRCCEMQGYNSTDVAACGSDAVFSALLS